MITSPPYPMIEMWDEMFSEQNPKIKEALNNKDGKTAFEFTGENFNFCLNSILEQIAGQFFQPIYYIVNNSKSSLSGMSNVMQHVREFFLYIRASAMKQLNSIYLRIIGFIVPIQNIIIKTCG